MGKTGKENKKYSSEFKISVIINIRERHLWYRETARKYWKVSKGQDLNYINTVKRWEHIYLAEGAKFLWKKDEA